MTGQLKHDRTQPQTEQLMAYVLLRKQTVTYDLSTASDECILQVATGHSICTV